jgi:hypothetical protein
MGAKFIVDRRCEVKTALTLTGLIAGVKRQGELRRVGELTAAGLLTPSDVDAPFNLLFGSEGEGQSDVTVRQLQDQTAPLMVHRPTCRRCPSSLSGHVGGCITMIPYPISAGVEYLLWVTAVKAIQQELPKEVMPTARAFVAHAQSLKQTPFSDSLRERGELLGRRAKVFQAGPLWRRSRLSSAQVLDAFFSNGLIGGDTLRIRAGFLAAMLAVGRAITPAIHGDEQRQALLEDTQPFANLYDLMMRALEQGLGVYAWP